MNKQMVIASSVEMLLMLASFFVLNSASTKAALRWAGTLLLGLTFCWSVVLGCVIALSEISYRI